MRKSVKTILLISISFLSFTILGSIYLLSQDSDDKVSIEKPQLICGNEPEIGSDSEQNGKNLFLINCASCHKKYKRATGPALSEINIRIDFPTENYLYDFLIDENSLSGQNAERAKKISKEYQSEFQHSFKITKADLEAILDYLN